MKILSFLNDYAERIAIVGILRGKISFRSTLASPDLSASLSHLYGVELLELALPHGRHYVPTGTHSADDGGGA